tara:strand:- start:1681 stop:2016 length:336 start_codon:yes stop_codon:yes gene_type:complete
MRNAAERLLELKAGTAYTLKKAMKQTTEQQDNIKRVGSRIARAIASFMDTHDQFRADDLRNHVAARCQCAPASADRILRDLRRKGVVNYRVLNRRQSLYKCLPVARQLELF